MISNIVPTIFTYIFWIILSNITNSEIIGIVSVVFSISMILSAISSMDTHIGFKTFLGKAVTEKNWISFKYISKTTFIFTIFSTSLVLLFSLNPFYNFLELMNLEETFVPIIVMIVLGFNLQQLFVGMLISALKSKSMTIPIIISSFLRIPIFFILFYFSDMIIMNAVWAYSSFFIISPIILIIPIWKILRDVPNNHNFEFKNTVKSVIQGSIPRWIPHLVGVIGSQSSILTVFAFRGSEETGLFFIAYAIFQILLLIGSSSNQVLHPILSGTTKQKDQIKILNQTIKLNLIIILPLSSIAFFHAESLLTIFGSEFNVSGDVLSILIIGIPFSVITASISFYLLANMEFKKVLILGLFSNILKIVLYFLLVPEFGAIGAVLGITVGAIAHFIFMITITKKFHLSIDHKILIVICLIPFGIGFGTTWIEVQGVSIIAIIVITVIIFIRMRIITEKEMFDVMTIFQNEKKVEKNIKSITKFLKTLKILND
jgi:O-antigen/teichoic acid export membrane protein